MKRVVLAMMLVLVALTSGGGVLRRYPMYPAALFDLTDGFQTNATEVARFTGLSGSGTYATDRAALSSHATTARDSWPYTITAGAWESDAGVCEPVGGTQTGSEYEISYAATDIFAMALSGQIENDSTLKAATRTRLLELTGITDFEASDISGGNQCILDLGAAAPHIVEAAMLLEDGGYSGWTYNDRYQLANWLATEVFPLVSWGIDARKNNWGIVTFAGALTIAGYAKGGIASLTKHNGSVQSPATYFVNAPAALNKWLSTAAGNQLDSDCYTAGQVFGLQSHGGFPDELRRSVGTADCPETSLAFDVPRGNSTFYQQKTTNGLAHVCEILRRYTGSGASCFDLTTHGGNDEALYDAAQFSTGATFQSYYLDDNAQGFRYVAGEYYADAALKAALDDGSVSVRGGRDYAYTKITHAPGIVYLATSCTDGVDCYCDTVSDTSLLSCEDFENPNYYSTTNWVRGTGTGLEHNRGGDSDWYRDYGSASYGSYFQANDPLPVRVGLACLGGVGGNAACSGAKEYCSAAQGNLVDGLGADCWQVNSRKPSMDIQRSGDFDEANSALTLTGGKGTTPDVGSGNTHMAYVINAQPGNNNGVGREGFRSVTEVGITMAHAYASNVFASLVNTDAWKHEEWGGSTAAPGEEEFWNLGNTGYIYGETYFPYQPILWVNNNCAAALAAATLHVGSAQCVGGDNSNTSFAFGMTANGTATFPTSATEPNSAWKRSNVTNYQQSRDFPLGTWACHRAHISGMGTSNTTIKIWHNNILVFHMSNFNGALAMKNQNYNYMFWNAYANRTAENGTPGLAQTTYRYRDNVHIRNGPPVECSQIGY